jgi:hypothetical protein
MNAVERYLAESPPPPGSDQLVLLEALRRARFALLLVDAVEAGVGVQVRDLLLDDQFFLVDLGLSRSAPVGMILAARVMAPEGIAMTTGAALPAGVLSSAERFRYLEGVKTVLESTDFHHMSQQKASVLAATVIRACLKHGAAEQIKYVEPGQERGPGSRSRVPPLARAVGRNDPCPCGSGKKFKRCCAKR